MISPGGPGDHAGADGGVAIGGLGVEADDEPLVLGDLHFLDLEVPGDVLVPALAGQGGAGFGGAGAELLPDDVAPAAFRQVAAVLCRGEPAVGDPGHLRQAPVLHVVLHLPDQCRAAGVPGPAPDPDRDPVPGHGHPDHDLGKVVTVVLSLAPGPERGRLPLPVLAAVRVPAGQGHAVVITGKRLVFLLRHEAGGCGIEEQQVDLKVQQRGEVIEDLPLQVVLDLAQPVHRPVARIVAGGGQARDQHVLVHPAGRGRLRRRGERPVRDQCEQDPSGGFVPSAAVEQAAHLLPDSRPRPQGVQHPGAAERSRLGELQAVGRGGEGGVRAGEPRDGRDQPLERLAVRRVLAAEVVDDLHRRPALLRVPAVMGELQAADLGTVLVPPWRRPQVHGLEVTT